MAASGASCGARRPARRLFIGPQRRRLTDSGAALPLDSDEYLAAEKKRQPPIEHARTGGVCAQVEKGRIVGREQVVRVGDIEFDDACAEAIETGVGCLLAGQRRRTVPWRGVRADREAGIVIKKAVGAAIY